MSKLPIFLTLLLINIASNIALPTRTTSKSDLKRSLNDEPIILPALAELSQAIKTDEPLKKKKNFSKVAQSLVLKEQRVIQPPNFQASPLVNSRGVFSPYEFCSDRADGLYDDPLSCENFIICYMHQTFRTKCAEGTKWNHHSKECDYPVLVDCARGTTPTTTSTTTTTRRTTTPKSTRKPFSNTKIDTTTPFNDKSQQRRKIKLNILLTIILVPASLLFLILIILVLWLIKNKIEQDNKKKQRSSSSFDKKSSLSSLDEVNCCCCFNTSKINPPASDFNTIVNKTEKTDLSKSNQLDITSYNQANLPYSVVQNYDHLNKLMHGTDCEAVTNSRATLASHFEDNNWDYNFAMRGLYLTQPWVKGNYSDPFTESSSESSGNKRASRTLTDAVNKRNHGGSDTDGLYA